MLPTIEIYHKNEIKKSLEKAFQLVENSVSETEEKLFLEHDNGKWSISENFQHLILSAIPVASSLKKAKILFSVFGHAKRASRSFDQLLQDYKLVLKNGAVATSRFVPDAAQEYKKSEMISNWKMIGNKFQSRINLWSEEDLDKYRIPHPVLGKLTFREMLFFTIFHTNHHLKRINEIKANNEKK